MAKLTKNQIGLIEVYADHCATFKKYWITYMLGGLDRVASESEAKQLMIEWAYDAYECGKALGLNDDQILQDVVVYSKLYKKAAA